MNPYYPVRPCPYKNPRRAPLHLQYAAFNHPLQNLYHVVTEGTWFFTRGIPRALNMMFGIERFRMNRKILNEGYGRHSNGGERRRHFGRNSFKSKSYYKRRRKQQKPIKIRQQQCANVPTRTWCQLIAFFLLLLLFFARREKERRKREKRPSKIFSLDKTDDEND